MSGDCSTTTSSKKKKTGTGTDSGVLALPGEWLAFLSVFVWGWAAFRSDPCPTVPLRAPAREMLPNSPGRKRWDRSTEHSSGRRRDVHKRHRGLLSLWFKSGQHCSPPKACGSQAVVRPPEQETQGLKPWAADVPVSSRRVPRRHGRITQQPEDVPHGGFGPDLPCYPPRSHGSSRYEVDDRETRCFRAPRGWECLTVSGEALRGVVL